MTKRVAIHTHTHRKSALLILAMLWGYCSNAQFGGESVFPILSVAPTARAAALGGTNVSVKDGDLSFGYQNPSLIDSSYSGQLALSFNVLYGMTKNSNKATYAQYARRIKGNMYSFGMNYISYGSAPGYDEFGNPQPEVSASDYVIFATFSRPLTRNIDFGVSLKPIVSHIATYTSVGMASDVGFSINDTAHLISVGLSARNIGYQIKTYTGNNRSSLPMQLDMGFTKRFAHAPLRLSLTYTHLESFDLSYQTEKKVSLLHSDDNTTTTSTLSKLTSHLVIGVEILLPRNIYLASGLNFRNKNDLSLDSYSGATGFSFGAGLRFKRVYVNYAYVVNHVAGGSTFFSARTNFDAFFKSPDNSRM